MTWTYLLPRSSLVVASPAPTRTTFSVTPGTGSLFIPGVATENGFNCLVQTVVGDAVTLSSPLTYVPSAGEEFVQTILAQKDRVRLLVGDVDTTDQQLQDEEISLFLQLRPNPLRAAAMAAEAIAARISRNVTYQVYQEIQERMTDAAIAYQRLAKTLRDEAARSGASPIMGGLLLIDKELAINDVTHIQPFFKREQFQEPGTQVVGLPAEGFSLPQY